MYWRGVLLAVTLSSVLEVGCEELFGNNEQTKHLLEHLTEAEKIFLFGANSHLAQFEIAHLKASKRRKRSVFQDDHGLGLLKKQLNLKLSPRNSFLDPRFLLMRRWSNSTETSFDQHNDEELDLCYHRSENAALYACHDVRGFVKSNDSYYFIHPLPERFHDNVTKVHVIVKRSITNTQNNEELKATCVERDNLNTSIPHTVKTWTKHRRKRDVRVETSETISLEQLKLSLAHRNKTIGEFLAKLTPDTNRQKRAVLPAVFVETAVFIDRDLYKHMTVNFPTDTERELVRFVLAMINAVQLIYHDPSLGRPVNFILKRLEILHEDPANLKRPHDIDRFLSNFCTWQRLENPLGDNDPLHWDHALILTGLDLYVVSKNGKVSSQVVGLAPVAGMCTVTSSCTVNEGRHFESVYVVAHEIGHNLGMRHDGPLADNGCDPSAYIMSPTLGSGKITWSQCSKNYLQKFLDTSQSRCLLDHGNSAGQLDHSAEGILPGERFDADQQCMLKYGRGSRQSGSQSLEDVCRDLHCQRERYTWTSHPALEGTRCGQDMYCRGGECAERAGAGAGAGGARGRWAGWARWSECASACLLDDRYAPAATGLALATRKCNRPRHDDSNYCTGHDKKYKSCHAEQCNNVPHMSVREFAEQICTRARDLDPDLTGTGLQRMDSDDAVSACAVWCDTRTGGYKSRGWSLPDGTVCSTTQPKFCISGVCQKFTCSSNTDNEFTLKPSDCEWELLQQQPHTTSVKSSWRRAAPGVEAGATWSAASGCHYRCVRGGAGLRLVRAAGRATLQLCTPDPDTAHAGCATRRSPYQYATIVCSKYKERVRRLSGLGMQISPSLEEPDRSCRVACQAEAAPQRFYLAHGRDGWLPLGTPCAPRAYCVSGRCLEFGPDDTPLSESTLTLPLQPRAGGNATGTGGARRARSVSPRPASVWAALREEHLRDIIQKLNLTGSSNEHMAFYEPIPNIEVDFNNPIHIAPEDTMINKPHRPTWD